MSDIRVASRYAKSLLDLALEKGLLEQVYQDMVLFAKTVKDNRDFELFLTNPIINHGKKLAVLKSLFTGKVSDLTLKFFLLVTEKNREAILASVSTEFIKQYNDYKGILIAHVTTAVPLTPELRVQLVQRLAQQTGKTIQLQENVDSALIGGLVVRIGDLQVDDSIKTNLRNLKNKFKENPYINKL
ncbi:ATP synthase F1 subunit delta [Adhaeribacter rhizoryzae]|uniref:ATP synthase subunit delta n=1 Tax=Adhaeribacter rhizoryzae TaxID=2607907 RepID=A0A5M6DH05_9BACT|nr:ATP synthase F1 subunit delta [Adhaeribacter rhizoryzae]KAA5545676.1 ATP synthase F1 subunit delta [Adhaeribacter rhizoryzae]